MTSSTEEIKIHQDVKPKNILKEFLQLLTKSDTRKEKRDIKKYDDIDFLDVNAPKKNK